MGSHIIESKHVDRAGIGYWNGVWHQAALPPALDPGGRGLNHYLAKKLHAYFQLAFRSYETRGKRLLEIGCGNSVFLPYFSKHFGFEVLGMDYSEIGCETARRILNKEGVSGDIYQADFFNPSDAVFGKVDVAVSFGVVEHFEDTVDCLRACSKFVQPGGFVITVIPNLAGLMGTVQKLLARSIYDIHVPLDRDALVSAHARAGLVVERSDYLVTIHINVVNLGTWKKAFSRTCATRLGSWLSKSVWLSESVFPLFKPNKWTSPYICCVARVPCE